MKMNRSFSPSALFGLAALALLLNGTALTAQEKITVRKMGDGFVVRSEFSPTRDLVIRTFRIANEAAYLVPKMSR